MHRLQEQAFCFSCLCVCLQVLGLFQASMGSDLFPFPPESPGNISYRGRVLLMTNGKYMRSEAQLCKHI